MVVHVVGVGADGWRGLGETARSRLRDADVVLGSGRQLGLLPSEVQADLVPLPTPLLPALTGLLEQLAGRRLGVLASGDPLLSGIGTTLVQLLGAAHVRVLPHVSSATLARARLRWSAEETAVVSLVGRRLELVHPHVQPGRRLVVLGSGAGTPADVAGLLVARGYGASRVTALSRLDADDEAVTTHLARDWPPAGTVDALVVTAVECVADEGTPLLPALPGLPDDAFEHDGQLTKREVRAVVLSRLAPVAGQLLWDVGAGAGSIAVEWMRSHPTCRAVAVESRADRAARVARNAAALGVPGLEVVVGRAPDALAGLATPDAVFVGGGLTGRDVPARCWGALPPGGRLVATAVTLESESVLARCYADLGGDLVRLAVARARPVGGFTGWDAAMPVTVWAATKGGPAQQGGSSQEGGSGPRGGWGP